MKNTKLQNRHEAARPFERNVRLRFKRDGDLELIALNWQYDFGNRRRVLRNEGSDVDHVGFVTPNAKLTGAR